LPVRKETVLFTFRHYENLYIFYDNPYGIIGAEEATSKISNEIRIELLNKSPESKIYIIGYLGTNRYGSGKQNSKGEWEDVEIRKLDKPSLMKRMLQGEVEQGLVKSSADASRIIKVDCGYQAGTRNIEIWFVPKGGEKSKAEAKLFSEEKTSKEKASPVKMRLRDEKYELPRLHHD
jgi:hypothetical protein